MHPDLTAWKDRGKTFDYLGFDVFYVVEGSGPHLLLIHGYPFSSFDWRRIWDELTSRYTVIAPDMLGMGFSEKPAAYRYSVHDHADMHEALLASLGVGACHVIAHDVGDSVAQELLARHEAPDEACAFELRSIAWLNGGMFNEAYTPRAIQRLLSASPLGGLLAAAIRGPVARRALKRTMDELFGPQTRPTPEELAIMGELLAYNDGTRVTHKVGRFVLDRRVHRNRWVRAMRTTTVPMRLINGPADPNSGRHMADRYRQLIPSPDVVLLDDAIGHWPQLEDPTGVLTHFLAFVAGV